MKKQNSAQFIVMKQSSIFKSKADIEIEANRVIVKLQNGRKREYEIEQIASYENEKLLRLKDKFDFAFSMLMSFAGALFMPVNLILSLILLSLAICDLTIKRPGKYIILRQKEQEATKTHIILKRGQKILKKTA